MDKIILYIITIFFLVGAIDYFTGNKLKVGEKFYEGITTMGPMFWAIAGIYSLTPIISHFIGIICIPISNILSIDPSLFPSMILAPDMGGYAVSENLAITEAMGKFSGVFLASTLGTTLSFTLPMAMSIIEDEDKENFIKGMLAGILTVPVVCFIGGIMQGLEVKLILWNLTPVILVTILIIIGMRFCSGKVVSVFNIIGKVITYIGIIGLVLQGINIINGRAIIPGLIDPGEVASMVTKIALVLAGAYPMISVISRAFHKPFRILGHKIGINSTAVVGILGALASNLLALTTLKDMNRDGKIIVSAFCVGGAFVFGGQMGFISTKAPELLIIFILIKFISGLMAMILAKVIFVR